MLLKSVTVSKKEFPNRTVFIKENIYQDYKNNSLSIEIYPDDYVYSFKGIDAGINKNPDALAYRLYKDKDRDLIIYIFNDPIYFSKKMEREKQKAYVVFSLYKRNLGKIVNYYLPFLIYDEKTNILLIEKRMHNVLLKKDIMQVVKFLEDLWSFPESI